MNLFAFLALKIPNKTAANEEDAMIRENLLSFLLRAAMSIWFCLKISLSPATMRTTVPWHSSVCIGLPCGNLDITYRGKVPHLLCRSKIYHFVPPFFLHSAFLFITKSKRYRTPLPNILHDIIPDGGPATPRRPALPSGSLPCLHGKRKSWG